jgi:hypothetical protein
LVPAKHNVQLPISHRLCGHNKRNIEAVTLCASGPAGSVDVGVCSRGQLVLHNAAHAGDIQAAGGHVSGQQHCVFIGLEAVQSLETLPLLLLGV